MALLSPAPKQKKLTKGKGKGNGIGKKRAATSKKHTTAKTKRTKEPSTAMTIWSGNPPP